MRRRRLRGSRSRTVANAGDEWVERQEERMRTPRVGLFLVFFSVSVLPPKGDQFRRAVPMNVFLQGPHDVMYVFTRAMRAVMLGRNHLVLGTW